jgi:hypothetical protein
LLCSIQAQAHQKWVSHKKPGGFVGLSFIYSQSIPLRVYHPLLVFDVSLYEELDLFLSFQQVLVHQN